jgi:uncharacterized iron-regulated membrane protein
MRKSLLNLHLYGALVMGIFIAIVGLSGSIIAFEPELDRLMRPDLYRVAEQGKAVTIAEMFRSAARAYRGQTITSIRLPQSADDTAQFGIKGMQVFLNPYTGAVVGTRTGATVLGNIHQIHQRLLMGETGSNVVTAGAVVLLFLVASGVYLWWPVKRASVKWSAAPFRVHFDLHNAAGIYSAAFLFVLALTGVAVRFDNSIEDYLHKSAGTKKIGRNFASGTPAEGQMPINADQAVAYALTAMPGTRPLSVTLPGNAKGSFLVVVRFPEDLTPGGRSWVNVDLYTGAALSMQNSRTVAMGSRSIIWNRAIHTGDVYGLLTKTLMSLSSLMLVVQTVTGYFMWWKKLRARQRALEELPVESVG